MLLLMPSPTLIGNRWYLRIRVPRDLLEQANGTAITLPVNGEMRTVTVKEAVKLALDTSDRNAAKARFTEAHGALLAHWERLRNIAAGSSAELSHRQIHGLIGRWYDWFIHEHEKSDEPAETWEHHLDRLADTAEKHETREGEERSPRHAASVRAAIQELSRLPSFLAEAGIGLSQVTHERLVDEMEPDLTVAFQLLQRRARGDYRPDTHRERFPTSTPLPELNATAKTNHRPDISLTFAAVIDEQVKRRSAGKGAKPMDEKTIQKFRLGADEFAAFRGSDDVAKELAPNHGWRHLFEDLCRNSGVSDAAATYITGRVTGKSSDGYGKTQVMLPGLAAEMRKIPVFPVDTQGTA